MLLALLVLAVPVVPRLLHSLPDDAHAFPKFRVAFLNGNPVLNITAQRWLTDGLPGGELQFLDQPWQDLHYTPTNGIDPSHPVPAVPDSPAFTLEHIRMGPRDAYICLIPKPIHTGPSVHDDVSDADLTPERSWSLLQPLAGTCLYATQGWFTYSYCHNDEIRQFRLLPPPTTRHEGTYKPEEDPEWESYTLGRAPAIPEPGADLTVAEQNARATNLELARNAGSRYLVQRWADGTICDKTGKGREVEVQFHCSMEMTDHILFVKETKICSYVLVIHTPRLCGEPGFKSRRDSGEEAQIRCREIVDTKPAASMKLPITDHPLKVPARKPILPAPKAASKSDSTQSDDASKKEAKDKAFNDLFRKTLEAIVKGKNGGVDFGTKEDDELVVEVVDGTLDEMDVESDRLVDALRAVGYDVRAEILTVKKDGAADSRRRVDKKEGDKKTKQKQKTPPAADPHRDEL